MSKKLSIEHALRLYEQIIREVDYTNVVQKILLYRAQKLLNTRNVTSLMLKQLEQILEGIKVDNAKKLETNSQSEEVGS